MILTFLLTGFLVIIATVWLLKTCNRKKNAHLIAQLKEQKIPFVAMPNFLVQAFLGKHRGRLELAAIQKHGRVFGTQLFGSKTIVVAEPTLIQQIVSKEFASFPNRRVCFIFF